MSMPPRRCATSNPPSASSPSEHRQTPGFMVCSPSRWPWGQSVSWLLPARVALTAWMPLLPAETAPSACGGHLPRRGPQGSSSGMTSCGKAVPAALMLQHHLGVASATARVANGDALLASLRYTRVCGLLACFCSLQSLIGERRPGLRLNVPPWRRSPQRPSLSWSAKPPPICNPKSPRLPSSLSPSTALTQSISSQNFRDGGKWIPWSERGERRRLCGCGQLWSCGDKVEERMYVGCSLLIGRTRCGCTERPSVRRFYVSFSLNVYSYRSK
jgi:hypothetical protein